MFSYSCTHHALYAFTKAILTGIEEIDGAVVADAYRGRGVVGSPDKSVVESAKVQVALNRDNLLLQLCACGRKRRVRHMANQGPKIVEALPSGSAC